MQGEVNLQAIDRGRATDGPALREQREILQDLFAEYQPRRVACMRAGSPIWEMSVESSYFPHSIENQQ